MGRSRLAGPGAGAAALAATVALAFDSGGFHPVSWDRALVLLAVAALGILLLAGLERPGGLALATVGALALLTAWTVASWAWSDAPAAAPEEAQRVAAYLAAAAVVVVAGRRIGLPWLLGGVAAGIVPVGTWNVLLRLAPDWTGRPGTAPDAGSFADPVGYGNGLAFLDVAGILLLLGFATAGPRRLRRVAAVLVVPLAADLGLLGSDGAAAALAAGVAAVLLVSARPAALRAASLLPLPAVAWLVVALEPAVASPSSSDVLAAAGPGHRLLLAVLGLAAGQAVAAALPGSVLDRVPRVPRRVVLRTAAVLAVAVVAAAPFAFPGHERGHYWRAAVHEIAANPLLGGGAGTYVDWWVRTRDVPLTTQEAHSLYLETLAELGPLGLLALAAALGAPLLGAWRLRGTRWGATLLAVLVAYDVHAAVDFDWELAGVTLPVILLAAAAAVHASVPQLRAPAPRLRAAATAAAAGLAAAGILALAGSTQLGRADDLEASGRNAAAEASARKALRFAPWSAEAWRVVARARLALGDRPAAREAFRRATQLDPADWQTWSELAAVSRGEPRRAALAAAARLNPLRSAAP